MIEISHFSKSFGEVRAVDNLSLKVNTGELFGLIGPDGAGKTTTMRTLCTLLPIEQGNMRIDAYDVAHDIRQIRSLIGYMPQRFSLYPDLSVEQNLRFFADLFGVPRRGREARIERLYEFSRLAPFKTRLAKQLSGGMKQKLALMCTLIHAPRVLILDEPTTGVDPVSRREFWSILTQLRHDGVTILISTPYMDEAGLCDRIAFMHRGRALAQDTPDRITQLFPYSLYEVHATQPRQLVPYFRHAKDVREVHLFGDRLHVSFETAPRPEDLQQLLGQAPFPIAAIERIEPGIEDTFLALMHSAA